MRGTGVVDVYGCVRGEGMDDSMSILGSSLSIFEFAENSARPESVLSPPPFTDASCVKGAIIGQHMC